MANKPLIDGIQVLRGIAALLVVIRHGTKEFEQMSFEVGQFGVDIFFVISGFVIYLTSRNIDWKLFAQKRFVRIAPLYWLMTIVTLFASLLLEKGETSQLFIHAIYSMLFVPHGNLFPTLYVGWTLNFEMWFYLLFGSLIFFGLPLLKYCSVFIFVAISIGIALLATNSWKVTALTVPLLPIIAEFLAGVWLAHFYSKGFSFSRLQVTFIFALAIIWLCIAPTASAYTIWRPLAWGVPAILIVTVVLALEKSISFHKFFLAMLIGNASYALYLIHPLVIRTLMMLNNKMFPNLINEYLILVLLAIGSLLSGVLLHIFVERRMLVILNKKLKLKKM